MEVPNVIEIARAKELEGGRRKLKGETAFRCPFDGKKRMRLYVNEAKNVWHCQHCKRGGHGGYSLAAFLIGLQWPHHSKEILFWVRNCTSALDRIAMGKLVQFRRKGKAEPEPVVKINRSGPTLISHCHKVLTLLPLAERLGRNKADILERTHFWLHFHRTTELRQTIAQFCNQFPWVSERQMKREIAALESKELLMSRKQGNDKFYRINYGRLQEILTQGAHPTITDNSNSSKEGDQLAPMKGHFGTSESDDGADLADSRTLSPDRVKTNLRSTDKKAKPPLLGTVRAK